MEHPCYRCQTDIQEGVAFCPHCGAPQIRVASPDNLPPEQLPSPEVQGNAFPPSQAFPPQPQPWMRGGMPYAPQSSVIQWDLAWRGALICGVGAAILSAIPLVSVGCCLWMLGAGALSVSLYQKRVPGTFITPGMGMRLGALTGAFGFVANAIVSTVSFVTFRSNGSFRKAMEEQMQKQMASNPDPKVQQMMQQMFDWMSTPQGAATLIVLVLLVMGILFIVFSAAGGALGASMFRGGRREFR